MGVHGRVTAIVLAATACVASGCAILDEMFFDGSARRTPSPGEAVDLAPPEPLKVPYTLTLAFDGGCDGAFASQGGFSGANHFRVPLYLMEDNGEAWSSVAYDGTFGDKHLVSSGTGTWDSDTGDVRIPVEITYTLEYLGYPKEVESEQPKRVTGKETFSGVLSGMIRDDPALDYETVTLAASGTATVDFPSAEPIESNDFLPRRCSARATGAVASEGWVEAEP